MRSVGIDTEQAGKGNPPPVAVAGCPQLLQHRPFLNAHSARRAAHQAYWAAQAARWAAPAVRQAVQAADSPALLARSAAALQRASAAPPVAVSPWDWVWSETSSSAASAAPHQSLTTSGAYAEHEGGTNKRLMLARMKITGNASWQHR